MNDDRVAASPLPDGGPRVEKARRTGRLLMSAAFVIGGAIVTLVTTIEFIPNWESVQLPIFSLSVLAIFAPLKWNRIAFAVAGFSLLLHGVLGSPFGGAMFALGGFLVLIGAALKPSRA